MDSKNKVAYSFVRKCGSTTWKTMMAKISSKQTTNFKVIHRKIFNNKFAKYGLEQQLYTSEEVKEYIIGYIKFIVVRNPIEHITVAYFDKVRGGYFYNNYSKYFKQHNNISIPLDITFKGFVWLLVSDHHLYSLNPTC